MEPNGPATIEYRRARFAAALPSAYLYTASHFWLARTEDAICRVGLTKFGTRMLGEIVDFGFELETNATARSGQVIGWIEGFKAVSDLVSIADGIFLGPNPELERQITLINQDPHGAGWLYAIKGTPDSSCVDARAYAGILDRTIDELLQA